MKILHVVPGLSEGGNGIAVAAKLIAEEQLKSGAEVEVVDALDFVQSNNRTIRTIEQFSEVWIHSMWLPRTMWACWKVIRAGKKLVRMTHANLDPLRYRYHGWKKRLVAPIERWLFRRTDRVIVTCGAEKKWCQQWGLKNEFQIVDLKRFFKIMASQGGSRSSGASAECRASFARASAPLTPRTSPMSSSQSAPQATELHLLYLGRRHPLKGVKFLEQAVEELKNHPHSNLNWPLELHCVSDHFGEELEKDWDWCDVLVLPTLSENFGLVVAEALERDKRVITTDGAPVWEGQPGVVYLKGFRDGTDAERVMLLKEALEKVSGFKFQVSR